MGYLMFYLDCSTSKLIAIGIGIKVDGHGGVTHGVFTRENDRSFTFYADVVIYARSRNLGGQ